MNQCHFLAAYRSAIHGAAIDENENYEQWVAEQGNVQLNGGSKLFLKGQLMSLQNLQ